MVVVAPYLVTSYNHDEFDSIVPTTILQVSACYQITIIMMTIHRYLNLSRKSYSGQSNAAPHPKKGGCREEVVRFDSSATIQQRNKLESGTFVQHCTREPV